MQSPQECFGVPRRANPPRSEIFLTDASTPGSDSGNLVKCWTNMNLTSGSDLLYKPNPILGDSILVLTSGVYAITYSDSFNSTISFGVTKNAAPADLNTNIISLPHSKVLIVAETALAAAGMAVTTTTYLNAGDVLRAQVSTISNNGSATYGSFRVTKVSY